MYAAQIYFMCKVSDMAKYMMFKKFCRPGEGVCRTFADKNK